MNVLLISRYVSAGIGGGEYIHALIAELLAKNGHKVWIITNKVEGISNPKHKNINYYFIANHKVENAKKQKQLEKFKFNYAAIKAGLTIIKKQKIDVIHTNPLQSVLTGAILSLLTSVPHIIALYDIALLKKDYIKERSKLKEYSKLKLFVDYWVTTFIYKLKYSAIHTISEAVRDDLIKWGIKKPIYLIPCAIPIPEPENSKVNPLQFVYVGRLVFYKNVQVAIKAIKIVRDTFPNVKLIIIGHGIYKRYLEKLVSNLNLRKNVIFKGYSSEEEKKKTVASSNAVIFPSIHEGFGLVVLEAFIQKKPVLVSNVRPLSDIVEHRKTGLVIPPNDENEWARSFQYLLKNSNNASKMGEYGRIELEKKYNLDLMWKRLSKMYNEIIKN